MPTLAGNKHLSVHFFLHGPRPSFDRKKVRVRSVGNGHQSGYGHNKWKHKQKIKDISIQGKDIKMHWKDNIKYGKIKFIILKDSWLHATSIKITVCNKLGLYPSPFHISTSSRLTLAGAFRGGYVAACSTAFRSIIEENDSGGYVDVPCPSKVKQPSSTADWLKF